jgi:hypothetical protein
MAAPKKLHKSTLITVRENNKTAGLFYVFANAKSFFVFKSMIQFGAGVDADATYIKF